MVIFVKIRMTFTQNSCTYTLLSLDVYFKWAGYSSRYSDWLRSGRSGNRIPLGARFSAPVQTGPGAHAACYAMGTGSFKAVKSSRGVLLTPHPLLVPWSRKSRTIPLLPLWAVRPVQSLSACTRVHFTFFYLYILRHAWFQQFIRRCHKTKSQIYV